MNPFKESEKYFNTPLQMFQYFDKYSRYNYQLGRRETWVETVDRTVEFLKYLSQDKLTNEEYELIREYILEMKVMPSMRLLAMAGDAAKRNHISIYNCFREDVEFITSEGVKSFRSFQDGDEIKVLTHSGVWSKAKVRNFGKQRLYPLKFHRGRFISKEIYVTKDHRWILSDNSETTELKSGQYVLPSPNTFNFDWDTSNNPMEKLYWCYGFVYGDGTKIKSGQEYKYSMVRLCGKDIKYLTRFLEMGFESSTSNSLEGDIIVYTGKYLKTLPNPEIDDINLIRAFVRGYLDADGAKNLSSSNLSEFSSIQTSDPQSAKFIKEIFPIVGITIFGIDNLDNQETNLGKRSFCRRFRISTNVNSDFTNAKFRAEFSEDYIEEDAWCLEVEDDKSFVLDIGVSTGNCSFMGVESLRCFGEALYISMSGCGVGFSVEKKYIDRLPDLPKTFQIINEPWYIEDSSEGWQDAIDYLFRQLFEGYIPTFDYSQIRPAGSVLKTKGGRASGPQPLQECIDFIIYTIVQNHYIPKPKPGLSYIWSYKEAESWKIREDSNSRLSSLEVHDMMCAIGNCAISGGTRRTAMISLFDLDDTQMHHSKNGEYNNYRWNANNSVVLDHTTDYILTRVMENMFESGTGEPGLFSIKNARETSPKSRKMELIAGTNPCGEINLRNMEFCNLTDVVAREEDDFSSLSEKVRVASMIGTIQSLATNFPRLRPSWEDNCNEERLLGIGLTGQMDSSVLREDDGSLRDELKYYAELVNREYAKKLGINPAAAITCVKPNGNSSQLLNSSSGLHPRYSKYYIRNVRVSTSSPIYKVLFQAGVPIAPENGQTWENMTTAVISFPVKSPDGAITKDQLSAIDMCEFWKLNKLYWTEHNPSVTIYYGEDEKTQLISWVLENKDIIGGMTFLPRDNAKYDNMPYIEITEEEYEKRILEFPKINWEQIQYWESFDMTNASKELACFAGSCEL